MVSGPAPCSDLALDSGAAFTSLVGTTATLLEIPGPGSGPRQSVPARLGVR